MSTAGIGSAAGIGTPPAAGATAAAGAEPAWVRAASSKVQNAYREGEAFEQVLLQQMAGSMFEGSDGGEAEGSEGSGGQSNPYGSLLTQALSDGVGLGGGLGLAAQLARQTAELEPRRPQAGGTAA